MLQLAINSRYKIPGSCRSDEERIGHRRAWNAVSLHPVTYVPPPPLARPVPMLSIVSVWLPAASLHAAESSRPAGRPLLMSGFGASAVMRGQRWPTECGRWPEPRARRWSVLTALDWPSNDRWRFVSNARPSDCFRHLTPSSYFFDRGLSSARLSRGNKTRGGVATFNRCRAGTRMSQLNVNIRQLLSVHMRRNDLY